MQKIPPLHALTQNGFGLNLAVFSDIGFALEFQLISVGFEPWPAKTQLFMSHDWICPALRALLRVKPAQIQI